MRRFIVSLVILAAISVCSSAAWSAEEDGTLVGITEKGKILYGIKAGPNFSTAFAEEGRLNFKTALAGGAFLSYNLNRSFQIQPEVMFMMMGWKEVAGPLTLTNKINYVDFNLLFKYVSGPKGRFQQAIGLGPYMGVKVSNSYDFNVEIPSEMEDAMDLIFDELKSTDFGVVITGEFNVLLDNGGVLIFDLRCNYGLTSIFDDLTIGEETFNLTDLKNMGIVIMAGYAF